MVQQDDPPSSLVNSEQDEIPDPTENGRTSVMVSLDTVRLTVLLLLLLLLFFTAFCFPVFGRACLFPVLGRVVWLVGSGVCGGVLILGVSPRDESTSGVSRVVSGSGVRAGDSTSDVHLEHPGCWFKSVDDDVVFCCFFFSLRLSRREFVFCENIVVIFFLIPMFALHVGETVYDLVMIIVEKIRNTKKY